MFNSCRCHPLLHLKGIITVTFQTTSPTPKFYTLPFSLKFGTTTSDPHSFVVSYLINNFGFSPQSALKASKRVGFKTSQQPDSVLAFFRNHGFSESQTNSIIRRLPELLACNPHKRVLPKFEFLLSKGASTSDILRVVNRSPKFLASSLENSIIPKYRLLRRFLQSDKQTIDCVVTCPSFFANDRVAQNVKFLLDERVTESNIAYLFRRRPSVFLNSDLRKAVDEVKDLGFDPSKLGFSVALLAKRVLPKRRWDSKVDAFKTWGWSEDAILDAFRKQPNCMFASKDKINAVLGFWVNQLGWNSCHLVNGPVIFGFSLENRIIPRASVLHYLLSKGLRSKNASLLTPFVISEKEFLQKFVKCFKEEETSRLLKLYQEGGGTKTKSLQDGKEHGGI